jgi:drug/metabolite transporter (DMT)-like permease
MTSKRATLELILASLLWGFGFIATVWALQGFSPLWVTFLRFALASFISLIWVLFKERRHLNQEQLKISLIPGILLSGTLILQTWGLKFTTATKSGFITCLYVLFVPILERVFLKQPLSALHFVFVTVALFGTALICDFQTGDWNRGDLITLACTLVASAQIFWFALIHQRIGSAVAFNSLQSLWSAGICALFLPMAGPMPTFTAIPFMAWLGIAALTIGSTVIAFALQVRAQKSISPSTASLLYLLESPFAMLFAILLLRESLNWTQGIGAFIILAAVLASIRVEVPEA